MFQTKVVEKIETHRPQ